MAKTALALSLRYPGQAPLLIAPLALTLFCQDLRRNSYMTKVPGQVPETVEPVGTGRLYKNLQDY